VYHSQDAKTKHFKMATMAVILDFGLLSLKVPKLNISRWPPWQSYWILD